MKVSFFLNNQERSGYVFHMFPHRSDAPVVTGDAGADQMATTADGGQSRLDGDDVAMQNLKLCIYGGSILVRFTAEV